jgi:hypothetical protein
MNQKIDFLGKLFDGVQRFRIGNLWGIMDSRGTVIYPCISEYIGEPYDGAIAIKKDKEISFIKIKTLASVE